MSESNVNVTPGIGGPNVDLEVIDNGNARQVIVIGDPTTATKVAPVDATLGLSVNVTNPVNSVQVSNFPASQPVTGTFYQATQPVSIATMPSTPVTGTFFQATQPISGNVGVSNFPTVLPSFPGDIAANRTRIVLSADAITSVIAEAMMTFQSYKAGVVAAGITSYTVTAGKTFRVQSIKVKIRPSTPSTTVTFANTVLRLREGSLITSPLIDQFPLLMQTNVDSNPTSLVIPDGLEFPAGTVLGMSHLASAATVLEHFAIVGFEY